MSENAILGTFELAELATYTSQSEVSSMPAGNLAHYQPGKRLRMTNLSQMDVRIDLAAAYTATGLSGWRILAALATLKSDATWEIWTGATEAATLATGTATYHAGPTSFWRSVDLTHHARRYSWHLAPTQRTERWLRVKFTDPSNTAGYVDLCLLVPHPGIQPSRNFKEQVLAGVDEEKRQLVAQSGSRHLQRRPRPRFREFTWQAHGATEYAALESSLLPMQERCGVSDAVFVVTDPEATTYTMNKVVYGSLASLEPVPLHSHWNVGSVTLRVEELL